MPRGKEPHRGGEDSLGDTRGGLERMNRRGLWVAGVVLILLFVGAGVLTVGTGYAQNEKADGAKCSKATLKGTYLFAQNGVEIKGNEQRPFAIAGYDVFDGNGEVKGVSSGNFNGEVFRNDRFTGTYTVKANCTGTVTFRGGGGATQGDIFIAPDGSKFAFVRTDPEDVSAGIDEQVTARRVGK
jgi:hypothetical protein